MLSVSIAFSLSEGLLATAIMARWSYYIKPEDRRMSIRRTTAVTVDDEPNVDESTPLLVKNKSSTETTSITQMRGLIGVNEVCPGAVPLGLACSLTLGLEAGLGRPDATMAA